MNGAQAMLEGVIVGIVSGACSVIATLAVVKNDVTWIKSQLKAIWKRLDRIEGV